MKRRALVFISSFAFVMLSLSSCGASNSTVGTSANNCLVPLAAALRSHHLGSQLLGVRLVSNAVATKFHFVRYKTRGDICLVGFRLPNSPPLNASMVVYAYNQNSSRVIGVRVIDRHSFRITHLV